MSGRNIIRVEKNHDYTTINNTSIHDKRLSWKAKGIHVFMLSRPDDWVFYNEELQDWAKDGRDSFLSGLTELKKYGYVRKERRRNDDGKFDYITVVYEVPQQDLPSPEKPYTEKPCTDNPSTGNPLTEKPLTENPQLLSTNKPSTNTLSTNKQNTNKQNVVVEATPANQNPFDFYHANGFGLTMNDITRQKILAWCEDLSDELVVYAMQISMERNKVSWSYAEGILKKWVAKHVKSIADVHALLAQHEAQRNTPKNTQYNRGRQEHVPDWFHQRQEPTPPQASTPQTIDFEAEREKILKKLNA
ncbi:DnaD domain protein [Lysinibacillus sp. KU-BSD001]|uniref:DnaD domain-containing protein n=1 Tax=Lysinibacillus sp. KU-BSD001 TaxID=3141328 RepID=UPI0036F0856C